ncbi:MAG: D-alanine--D-alanine ligase [Bacteroidales bacterium]|nr:D-alanine--D-alanine ligase [Candidatus Sodaliphilus aphodohippi]
MNIVVLAGGTSTERLISIISGTGVCRALRAKGHRAVLIDIFAGDENADKDNFFPADYDVDKANAYISSFNDRIGQMVKERRSFFGPNVLEICQAADIAFMALHGANGEDGRVQATFDLMGIKYTGAGCLSSAMAMDKTITKNMFIAGGVPTAKAYFLQRGEAVPTPADKGIDYPVIVKPACGGSSVGITIANNDEEYNKSVKTSFDLEPKAVVEEFVKGREFSVAVVDGKALPVIEIAPKVGFYDYKNKYEPGATIETCPADITEEQTTRMQHHAEQAMAALGIEAYGRIDFIMTPEGKMIALEANTLPGMTATSLLPQEAAQVGYSYEDLCEYIIKISLNKYKA